MSRRRSVSCKKWWDIATLLKTRYLLTYCTLKVSRIPVDCWDSHLADCLQIVCSVCRSFFRSQKLHGSIHPLPQSLISIRQGDTRIIIPLSTIVGALYMVKHLSERDLLEMEEMDKRLSLISKETWDDPFFLMHDGSEMVYVNIQSWVSFNLLHCFAATCFQSLAVVLRWDYESELKKLSFRAGVGRLKISSCWQS